MLELSVQDNRNEARLSIDGQDGDAVCFTFMKGNEQHDFVIFRSEWERLKAYINSQMEFYEVEAAQQNVQRTDEPVGEKDKKNQ